MLEQKMISHMIHRFCSPCMPGIVATPHILMVHDDTSGF
jgi:hypothetical protein